MMLWSRQVWCTPGSGARLTRSGCSGTATWCSPSSSSTAARWRSTSTPGSSQVTVLVFPKHWEQGWGYVKVELLVLRSYTPTHIVARPGRHRAIVCAGVALHRSLEEILLGVLLLPGGQGLGGWWVQTCNLWPGLTRARCRQDVSAGLGRGERQAEGRHPRRGLPQPRGQPPLRGRRGWGAQITRRSWIEDDNCNVISVSGFGREFEKLTCTREKQFSTAAATLPGNRDKNRYNNVLPCE